MPKARN